MKIVRSAEYEDMKKSFFRKHNNVPNLKKDLKSYYEKKYEFEEDFGTHTNEEILEMMFYKFNMERPEDFKGHSLSTSDIIILNDDAMWFCDSYGWQELE